MIPTSTRTLRKINPSDGQPLHDYAVSDEAEIRQGVQQSSEALQVWRQTGTAQRARLLKQVANRIYQNARSIAEMISSETGKPYGDALDADIATALSILNYYAQLGPRLLKPRHIRPDLISLIAGRTHREIYHPRGVLAVISPWNYPFAIPVSGIAAALMAGNTVILKPSELSPGTGEILVRHFREALTAANLPADIVQLVQGDGQTGAALLAQDIDGVIFTGSGATGAKIQASMQARGLWSSLELGGSDAMIILEGCDLELAASYALWGRFTNAGQACASVKRLFVPASQEKRLLELLQAKMAQLRTGAPNDPAAHVGPLISEAQRNVLEAQVADAIERGAQCLAGGHQMDRPGWFYAPTLLSNVPPSARILHEEVFGPVLPVLPYNHIDEAITQANASTFGLTASLFGPPGQARTLATRLQCATVVINDVGTSNYAMVCAPWGGWKDSGSGVSHGERALLELSRVQVVSENQLFGMPGLRKPMWHFSQSAGRNPARSKAVLAFSGQQFDAWNPATWMAFWHHRAGRKL